MQSRNVSSADIRGVEAAMRVTMSPSLGANFVINYVYGEEMDNDATEHPADRIPPFNGRLSLKYQASDALSIEPYLVFAGSQDRLSPRDAQDVPINPAGTPGWLSANVAASWQQSERLQATARAGNIFDQHHRLHGSGIDATGRNLALSAQHAW